MFPLVQLSSEWKAEHDHSVQRGSGRFPLVQLSSEWKDLVTNLANELTPVSISSTFQRGEGKSEEGRSKNEE